MPRRLILDLCGGTGAWSQPYRDARTFDDKKRYNVVNITLPHYDVTKINFEPADNVLEIYGQRFNAPSLFIPVRRVYGILAAPPCTEFSLAHKGVAGIGTKPDWAKGMVTVEACERIIRACMAYGDLKFWAMENPMGHLRKFLGRPRYTFEHWWFDENCWVGKQTDLWGYFNEPERLVFSKPEHIQQGQRATSDAEHWNHNSPKWYTPECPPEYAHLNLNRAAIRAITPRGFAQQFFKANK